VGSDPVAGTAAAV